MFYSGEYDSPVGRITLASDGENLIGLWLAGQKYFALSVKNAVLENADLPVLNVAKRWLDDYFLGKAPAIKALPLAPVGSAFRRAVWQLLCEIPYGEYTTYGEIARKMAIKSGKQSMSSQAVGGAVGHNPLSIIIPCHRVIGTNRSLTGYAGGIDKKIKLLELEGVDTSSLIIPTKGTAL